MCLTLLEKSKIPIINSEVTIQTIMIMKATAQQLNLLQSQVAYGRINFQPESCLVVAFSIRFQSLISTQLLVFNKSMLPSFALIEGRSCVFIMFLKLLQNIEETFPFLFLPPRTKLGRVMTYHEGLPPIKSHEPLITWPSEIPRQTETIVTPLSEWLWPPNLAEW